MLIFFDWDIYWFYDVLFLVQLDNFASYKIQDLALRTLELKLLVILNMITPRNNYIVNVSHCINMNCVAKKAYGGPHKHPLVTP